MIKLMRGDRLEMKVMIKKMEEGEKSPRIYEEGEKNSKTDEEVRVWNLRPRKPISKGNDGENKTPSTSKNADENKRNGGGEKKKPQKMKVSLSVALTKQEIEEVFIAWTEAKPRRRPQKRAKHVQILLDSLIPGLHATGISIDSYKSENKTPSTSKNADENKRNGGGEKKKPQKMKVSLSVALTKQEIEEVFIAWTEAKPRRRPQKRAKHVQILLDSLIPGLHATGISIDSYKSENKTPSTSKNADGNKRNGGGEKKKPQKMKVSLSVALTKQEIEEVFIAWTEAKPRRRPQKRAKHVQILLDSLIPGLHPTGISIDSYKSLIQSRVR